MLREMLQAKIHRATVSDTRLTYAGSLTVDSDLMRKVGMIPHQKVQVVNCNNGTRLETYLIEGDPGSGDIIVNGAAARLAQPGDRIIIIAYATYSDDELAGHKPKVIVLDERNGIEAEL